ncbi:uncharacterized protein LOC129742617 [Uranotaenia lowii]|uniref:uncharacterized protein LOC129742617 n=1 Tax=Uranotaenia lowii TaxID=190385 RepID=UPI00247A45E7|nr:uncharacterized protein LOC129742617 [Uranotaenia lowii]
MYNKVFTNQDEILAIKSECRESNRVTICERRQLVDISNSHCEAPLLKGRQGQCPSSESPTSTETRIIAPGTLLVITINQKVAINSTCGIPARTLTGIHLITFHNCSIYIKNELFENYELKFNHASVLPMQLTNIKTLHIERHVNLSELHELNLINRRHLETVDFKYRLSLGTFSTVILLILALLGLGIYKWKNSKPMDCSGRAKLKGGRVKEVTALEQESIATSLTPSNTRSPEPVEPAHANTQTAWSARRPAPSNIVSPEPGGPVRANTQVAWSARSNMGTHQPTMDLTGAVSLTGARHF